MNDRELENTVQDGSVCVCGHTNLPYMNIHAHPNTHTQRRTSQYMHTTEPDYFHFLSKTLQLT